MRKKAAWLIAVCLGVGLISYAVLGLDSGTVSAELSQQTHGTFVRLDDNGKKLVVSMGGSETAFPASTTVWVYRNMQKSDLSQLKAGDSLDIILNNKDQAAYVKAISPEAKEAPAPAVSDGSTAEAAVQPQTPAGESGGAAAPVAGPSQPPAVPAEAQGAAAAAAASTGNAAASGKSAKPAETGDASKASAAGWEKLSFEWKSRDLVLEVKQEAANASNGSELYLKRNDRSVVHLNGEAAAAMIQLFLKGLPAEPAAFEKALKQKIATEFQLKDTSPEWKLDVKWKEASDPASAKPAVYHPDPQGKAKGLDKDKESPKDKAKGKSGKEEEKEKGKNNAHKNDEDDED